MKSEAEREAFRVAVGLPKLELPPEPPITAEELEQRHEIAEAIRRLQREIGPVDMTIEELFGEEDDDD